MNSHDKVRESVSSVYAGATPASTTMIGGYRAQDIEGAPQEAVSGSFACGNPLAFGDVRAGETVLDLGCGAGLDLLVAAKAVGPTGKVIGVDMTEEMIERARKNITAAGVLNVEVRNGLVEELPIESGSIDWVISNCALNLSPEKPRAFSEIARVLKPGGRLRVSDIVIGRLPDWIRESAALTSSCVEGLISEEVYIEGLKAASLLDVEVVQRRVYSAQEIAALVTSQLPKEVLAMACCGGASLDATLIAASEQLEGEVWSAMFFARKSAA